MALATPQRENLRKILAVDSGQDLEKPRFIRENGAPKGTILELFLKNLWQACHRTSSLRA
jgi:hypothetical protein